MSSLEPPAPSPRGKLSKLSLRNRKDKDDNNSSTLSLDTTNDDPNPSERMPSVEGLIDKLKDRGRKSMDDRGRKSTDNRGSSADNGSGKRLSKLLPSKLKSRRGSKANNDDSRRSSAISMDGGDASSGTPSANESQLSLEQNGSGRSSLLTDDSDNEGRPSRPSLSPRDSHAGYLTLSSPLIKARTTDTANSIAEAIEPSESRSSVSLPEPPQPLTTDLSAEIPDQDRRTSPVDRFREAFTASKRKSIGSGKHEPDTRNNTSGGGFGGLFGAGSRRGSLNLGPDSASSDALSQSPTVDDTKPVESNLTSNASARLPFIDTVTRPATPPNTVVTPSTLVTPPTPTITQSESFSKHSTPIANSQSQAPPTLSPAKGNPSQKNTARGRPKSAYLGSSKLSNAISASPLTPTIEETKTPGGSLSTPSGSGGFFSSVFSAAQNAANQLSTSINTSIVQNQKGKASPSQVLGLPEGEELVQTQSLPEESAEVTQQAAVETLGQGELNLSHLGITDSTDPSPMTSSTDLADRNSQSTTTLLQNEDRDQKAEESAAARAVSIAYDKPIASVAQATGDRPMSITSASSLAADQSPSRAATTGPDINEIKRSGSVRSRISERTKRRHRASSATTGGTLAAAITAANSTLAHPGSFASGNGHRLTGFAVASSKRNKDFHQLFRSVPEDDYLIEDYSAALQRDILLHGRFYVSEGHICFSSNILGWVTNLVISFDEIVSVEKKNTAIVFPNAIVIQTLNARNVFASFVARDSTYELLVGIWKISHPNLKSSINGVTLDDAGTGDKTEKSELHDSDDGSDEDSDDVYDEDAEDDEDMGSFTEPGGNGSIAESEAGDLRLVSRKTSAAPVGNASQTNGTVPKGLENADPVVVGAAVSADFPGVPTHGPTECSEPDTHYDKPLIDTTIPAPLGKVYSMMFGPASGIFMRKWLVDDQKSRELSYEDDKIGLDDTHRTFVYSYIKPLNAPVGPKQTKCIVTCTLENLDLEKSVSVKQSTQTPDVPSGNIFTTKTKYCLMWGPGNSTRIIANYTMEWTGKSWLKGPIESGTAGGQTQYVKDIVASLRAAVTTKPPVKGVTRGKVKGKRRRGETFDAAGTEAERAAEASKGSEEANWGLLEPLRGTLGPLVSIIQPLLSARIVIAVLCILLAQAWFFGPRAGTGVGFPTAGPARFAAYEAMWQSEESELWDWLEERVGVNDAAQSPFSQLRDDAKQRQKVINRNRMSKKVVDQNMDERHVDDAIKLTGERLGALKEAVDRNKLKANKKLGL